MPPRDAQVRFRSDEDASTGCAAEEDSVTVSCNAVLQLYATLKEGPDQIPAGGAVITAFRRSSSSKPQAL
jgi:hypothetical protein